MLITEILKKLGRSVTKYCENIHHGTVIKYERFCRCLESGISKKNLALSLNVLLDMQKLGVNKFESRQMKKSCADMMEQ